MHSPFIAGILFLLSLGAGFTGMAYGFSSGRYRSDNDVIEGLTQPIKLLGVYFVIAFFCCPDVCLFRVFSLTSVLRLWERTCFLLLSRLLCPHSSCLSCLRRYQSDYGIRHFQMGIYVFHLHPMFAQMGISPDRHASVLFVSETVRRMPLLPFLFYMPLVLTYMRQYDKQITYGSLLKYTWRYSLCILAAWTLLFIVWYLLKIPMGL